MNEVAKPDSKLLPELNRYLHGFITDERRERIEAVLNNRTRHVNVVLEDLYQPNNASAVMRSCDAFGVQDLHVIEDQHRFKPAAGIALGAEKWLSVYKYNNQEALKNCIYKLRKSGYQIIATSPKASHQPIQEINIHTKTSLMFGAELTGLSDEAFELADSICCIPMSGFTESFNLSVSVAICLYEVTTRIRLMPEIDWKLTTNEKIQLRFEFLKKSVRAGEQLVEGFLSRKS